MEDSQMPFPDEQLFDPAADHADGGFNVLKNHQKRNKPKRPPQAEHLAYVGALHVQQDSKPHKFWSPSHHDHLTNDNGGDGGRSLSPAADPVRTRRQRNTVQPKGPASDHNMSFYGLTFKNPLALAKNNMCHYMATENPFPSRTHHFRKATEFLSRRIQESIDLNIELDGEFIMSWSLEFRYSAGRF